MNMIAARLKRFPTIYVGKRNPSYAFLTDGEIVSRQKQRPQDRMEDIFQTNAHWYTTEKYAHVWTNIGSLKRLLSYCRNSHPIVYSEYEFVLNGEAMDLKTLLTKCQP
jgi:hypothetical protein